MSFTGEIVKIGDLVYDSTMSMTGLIINYNERRVVPFDVLYENGNIDMATEWELEVISESRRDGKVS